MLALVTGGGGFLGQAIVRQLLERGDRVRIIARGDYPALRELGAETHRGDIQNLDSLQEACRGVEVVFHAAAKAGYWGKGRSFTASMCKVAKRH
jgi:nucleoside-diphosphate-sugar epimerase